MPPLLPEGRWSLKPPFHPYRQTAAVHFCCTFLRVASTGRYPASCPVKPGLSSPAAFRHLQQRSSVLLIFCHLILAEINAFCQPSLQNPILPFHILDKTLPVSQAPPLPPVGCPHYTPYFPAAAPAVFPEFPALVPFSQH